MVLLALFIALRACGYIFSMYHLLYSPRGVTFGASYMDVYAVLPGLRIIALLSLIFSTLLMINLKVKRPAIIYWTLGIIIVASVLFQGIYPGLVQKFQVAPNEFAKEEPYSRRAKPASRTFKGHYSFWRSSSYGGDFGRGA